MATATALLHFRRPDVSVVYDEVVVVSLPSLLLLWPLIDFTFLSIEAPGR